jgi:hypothetical protein
LAEEIAALLDEARYFASVASERRVRYLRCVGGYVNDSAGASVVFVRLEHRGEEWVFGGYIILNDHGQVVEKSVQYGQYEEEDDWIERQSVCTPVSRDEFAAAWQRPYAKRSLKQRLLSNLNGCRDDFDPSESDPPSST